MHTLADIRAKWNGIDIRLSELHVEFHRKDIEYSDMPFGARNKSFATKPIAYMQIVIDDVEFQRIHFDANSTVEFSADTVRLHGVKAKAAIESEWMSSDNLGMMRKISLVQIG